MIRFASPEMLRWLWLVPFLAALTIFLETRARRRLVKAFGGKIGPFLGASVSSARRYVKLVLRMMAYTCFVFALARPQMGQSLQEVKSRGVELMIAVDVSNSMLAEDVKPSRLEYAKAEIMRLLDQLSGDKVGLIAFAGSSVLLSPITTDLSSLKMFVESLTTESVGSQGTSFKAALDEAKQAFERGGVDSDDKVRTTRVILLASDGEDQEEGAVKAARKLADEGTRIFAVAFGTEKGAPIPLRDERGMLAGYKRDKGGQNVVSTVRGDFLRQLAQTGKGTFHHATFGGQEAKMIKADLDQLQKAEFSSSLATNYDERYQWPLLVGILFSFADLLIGERKRTGRIWKGRFEVAQS